MAFVAAPEVAAAANSAAATGAAAGAAKGAATRKAPSTGPAGNRSAAPTRGRRQRSGGGQGDGGQGRSTWSQAGNASRTIVTVQAPQPIETGAGFLLGLIAWAIAINLLRGGPAQAGGWILAKLINKPYGSAKDSNVQPPAKAAKPSGPVTA